MGGGETIEAKFSRIMRRRQKEKERPTSASRAPS